MRFVLLEELLTPLGLQVGQFTVVTVLVGRQQISIPLVEFGKLIGFVFEFVLVLARVLLPLSEPLGLFLVHVFS